MRPQKITFGEMRSGGGPIGILVYCVSCLRTCARFLAMITMLRILAVVLLTAAIIGHYSRQPRLSSALLMASLICATYY
jgi:hypothetical protein